MSEKYATEILGASVGFVAQRFEVPMQLSVGLIENITEARVSVRVRVDGREQEGFGSIYLSDLWAWRDRNLSHEEQDRQLRHYTTQLAENPSDYLPRREHPLELGLQLHERIAREQSPIPLLARLMCASPFDAAIHDAVGQLVQQSAFAFYEDRANIPTADSYFPDGACAAITEVLKKPSRSLQAWWVVNAHDDLGDDFRAVVEGKKIRCFKIKLLGQDVQQDVESTVAVFHAARRYGVKQPVISCDSNEANPNAESVLTYLESLRRVDREAFDALAYLEQPTPRDIRIYAFDWRQVTRLKPVMLDEGLLDFDTLPLVRAQGWSGIALKTCKGHSFMLVAAAWAHRNGLLLCQQDLTNAGLSAIHSFLMATHLPVINGIELNSPQFTPRANDAWLPRLSSLFAIEDGAHAMESLPIGLGSHL